MTLSLCMTEYFNDTSRKVHITNAVMQEPQKNQIIPNFMRWVYIVNPSITPSERHRPWQHRPGPGLPHNPRSSCLSDQDHLPPRQSGCSPQ